MCSVMIGFSPKLVYPVIRIWCVYSVSTQVSGYVRLNTVCDIIGYVMRGACYVLIAAHTMQLPNYGSLFKAFNAVIDESKCIDFANL